MSAITMTDAQRSALTELCRRYGVAFDPANFHRVFDLPSDWVAGWVNGIYVGCSPEGRIHS